MLQLPQCVVILKHMDATHKLTSVLKSHGHSVTGPRRQVFDSLLQANEPLSISQLIARLPSLDKASVYRIVKLYEQIGLVHRVWNGFKSKIELSESFSPHHHHFTCLGCGQAQALKSEGLERSLHDFERQYGFSLVQHSVELSGYCRECTPSS